MQTTRRSQRRIRIAILTPLAVALLALPAQAGELYISGDLAISGGHAETSGETEFFRNTGSDGDSSPAYGGALGIGYEMNEMVPRIWKLELPSWKVRFELEYQAGRDYELRTEGGDGYFSDVDAWSAMPNLWLEIPIHKPFARFFGRVPLLEPLKLYGGGGLGVGHVDASTTDNVSSGSESSLHFAYQAGAGITYGLTPQVTLALGYRYTDLGDVDIELRTAPDTDPFGNMEIDLTSHEFVAGLRYEFHSLPFPDGLPSLSLPKWSLPKWSLPGW